MHLSGYFVPSLVLPDVWRKSVGICESAVVGRVCANPKGEHAPDLCKSMSISWKVKRRKYNFAYVLWAHQVPSQTMRSDRGH